MVVVVVVPVVDVDVVEDKSGGNRSCMEGSRCCDTVEFVAGFGLVVRRPCRRWLGANLVFSSDGSGGDDTDEDAVEEAPRNSSHEDNPVDRGSSSSSSPPFGVSPVSGGGKRDE